jgi:hypothetical protein
LTKSQYAGAKSVCLRTVEKWMKGRVIPFIKIGRIVRLDPVKCDKALEAFEHKSITNNANTGGVE